VKDLQPNCICPLIGTEKECNIDGVLCSSRRNRLYLITINQEDFVWLNNYEIHSSAYDVKPEDVAELIGNALKVKAVQLDAQDLADNDTDATYVEVCEKAIWRHEGA
jgi:hypothetical protein